MNYKPSKAGNVLQAFTKLVEIMLVGSVAATLVGSIVNLITNLF